MSSDHSMLPPRLRVSASQRAEVLVPTFLAGPVFFLSLFLRWEDEKGGTLPLAVSIDVRFLDDRSGLEQDPRLIISGSVLTEGDESGDVEAILRRLRGGEEWDLERLQYLAWLKPDGTGWFFPLPVLQGKEQPLILWPEDALWKEHFAAWFTPPDGGTASTHEG